MRPITREAIVDRRQPMLRWGAVFAGAVISAALWIVLQMIGMGIGLAEIDVDDSGALRAFSIGTTAWTCVAPLVALFVGGAIAGRMAGTHERGVGATHGLVVWAVTSLVALAILAGLVASLGADALLGAGGALLVGLAACLLGGAAGVRTYRAPLAEPRDVDVVIATPPAP